MVETGTADTQLFKEAEGENGMDNIRPSDYPKTKKEI
jgi:hypothetical protein